MQKMQRIRSEDRLDKHQNQHRRHKMHNLPRIETAPRIEIAPRIITVPQTQQFNESIIIRNNREINSELIKKFNITCEKIKYNDPKQMQNEIIKWICLLNLLEKENKEEHYYHVIKYLCINGFYELAVWVYNVVSKSIYIDISRNNEEIFLIITKNICEINVLNESIKMNSLYIFETNPTPFHEKIERYKKILIWILTINPNMNINIYNNYIYNMGCRYNFPFLINLVKKIDPYIDNMFISDMDEIDLN